MIKERTLMESLAKKGKAVKEFERQRQIRQKEAKVRNVEKSDKTAQQLADEQRKQQQLQREMKQKEKRVQSKLQEAEQARLLELELKRERMRLVHEENKKRIELQKRNMHYKKLQIFEKHKNIEDNVNKMMDGKAQFIECSRIANEIRVQKMKESKGSPPKRHGKRVLSVDDGANQDAN